MSRRSDGRGWRRLVPVELAAAVATVSAALAFTNEVERHTGAVADRVGQARYQLDALIAAMRPVAALADGSGPGAAPTEASLRASLGVHDWSALFGDRCVALEPSRNAAAWVLVLQPNRASSCGTH